jgi:hypothetical protein
MEESFFQDTARYVYGGSLRSFLSRFGASGKTEGLDATPSYLAGIGTAGVLLYVRFASPALCERVLTQRLSCTFISRGRQ